MLVIPGKNPMGNVVHLVVGPETELVMDMQGAAIMDISKVLNKFDASKPVYVSVTRTRNETMTSDGLKKAMVPHMGTLSVVEGQHCDGDCDNCKSDDEKDAGDAWKDTTGIKANASIPTPTPTPPVRKPEGKSKAVIAVCAYCKKPGPLLDIPGFKICLACAQIELGLNRNKKQPPKDTPHA